MKEFSTSASTEPIKFSIDGDTFVAVAPAKLPGNVLLRYVETIALGRVLAAYTQFFISVLDDESMKRFQERLDSEHNPINLSTMVEIADWLIKDIYGGKAKGLL